MSEFLNFPTPTSTENLYTLFPVLTPYIIRIPGLGIPSLILN